VSFRAHRASIFCENAEILSHESFPGDQYVLRVCAEKAARHASPGTFAHVRCDVSIPLRRPLSIMRADPKLGMIEFLYRPIGRGLALLAEKKPGDFIDVLAPIGNGFALDPQKPLVLAVGGGVGIPPIVFLAERLKSEAAFEPVVLLGSEVPFPFEQVPSALAVAGATAEATDSLALFEQWGIPARLASKAGLAGSFRGFVPDFVEAHFTAASRERLNRTQVFACGPEPMLAAMARITRQLGVRCALAVEEYMACGVGGCAGCAILLKTPEGDAMKRVCVDGPVFAAEEVYPA
jgi:dihydroorotate dehydrogenase electron transfer subunit